MTHPIVEHHPRPRVQPSGAPAVPASLAAPVTLECVCNCCHHHTAGRPEGHRIHSDAMPDAGQSGGRPVAYPVVEHPGIEC